MVRRCSCTLSASPSSPPIAQTSILSPRPTSSLVLITAPVLQLLKVTAQQEREWPVRQRCQPQRSRERNRWESGSLLAQSKVKQLRGPRSELKPLVSVLPAESFFPKPRLIPAGRRAFPPKDSFIFFLEFCWAASHQKSLDSSGRHGGAQAAHVGGAPNERRPNAAVGARDPFFPRRRRRWCAQPGGPRGDHERRRSGAPGREAKRRQQRMLRHQGLRQEAAGGAHATMASLHLCVCRIERRRTAAPTPPVHRQPAAPSRCRLS